MNSRVLFESMELSRAIMLWLASGEILLVGGTLLEFSEFPDHLYVFRLFSIPRPHDSLPLGTLPSGNLLLEPSFLLSSIRDPSSFHLACGRRRFAQKNIPSLVQNILGKPANPVFLLSGESCVSVHGRAHHPVTRSMRMALIEGARK